MNVGLRVVNTDETSSGSQTIDGVLSPHIVSNNYTNFLPSANFRYDLAQGVVARATYARTMTRPELGDLSPTSNIESGTRTGARGTPTRSGGPDPPEPPAAISPAARAC